MPPDAAIAKGNTTQSLRHDFEITIKVRAPVLCAGLDKKAWGLDVAFIRNQDGAPIIPRDHVKGHVRQALETLCRHTELVKKEDITRWLGKASEKKGAPEKGRVIFDDLVLRDAPSTPEAPYARIRIDEDKGTVKKGMLAFIEQIAPPGAELTFSGRITALLEDDDATHFEEMLRKALALVPAIGAMKSVGFGEVVSTEVCPTSPEHKGQTALSLPEADSVTFEVTFDRPIIIDSQKEADNLVVGSEIIPGGAIKGALAWLLGVQGRITEFSDALSQIVISHAFPLDDENKEELAHPVPLCMASFKHEDKYIFKCDLGASGDPLVMNGQAPFYPPDWKADAFEAAKTQLGYPTKAVLRREQRTRVAIDYEKGAAEESQLFTEVAISERIDGKKKRRWRFTIARNGADKQQFKKLLEYLRSGLFNLGRTNATMTVEEIRQADAPGLVPFDEEDGTYAVMLLTPAVMLDALALLDEQGEWRKTAKDAYQDYWQDVLPDAELVDFMASQHWAGGYLGLRFRPYGDDTYYPFMLTEPGSVFLLRLKKGGKEKLENFLRNNLPHAPLNGRIPNWEKSPFVPENGYGRIRCITRGWIEGGRRHA